MTNPDSSQSAGALERGRRHPVVRGWNGLVDGLAALGTALIIVLMVIISSDVVARNVVGGSLPLVSELGALTLVMIVYLQLGTTVRHDRLARTDFFLGSFRRRRPRAGAVVVFVFDLIGGAAVGTMAVATLRIVGKDLSSGEYIGVTGLFTLPVWPFRVVILVGLAVATVQFFVQSAIALRAGLMPRGGSR
jgi:TRAP-type mannitol/chloroaromatic compound transport system permease small subunit